MSICLTALCVQDRTWYLVFMGIWFLCTGTLPQAIWNFILAPKIFCIGSSGVAWGLQHLGFRIFRSREMLFLAAVGQGLCRFI